MRLAIILAIALLFRGLADGQTTPAAAATNNPPVFQISTIHEAVPSLPPVLRVYVKVGTNQFAFLVPPGFRMNDSTQERVSLVNEDYTCFLTLRLAGMLPPEGRELNPDTWKDRALATRPGAGVKADLSVVAGGLRGPAFDFEWMGRGSVFRSERVAFIPTESWVVELSLLANSDKFSCGINGYNDWLLNFRASEAGKLEIAHLSDRL